jgi:hypothetical protein
MANIHPHIEAMLNRYDLKKDDPFEVLREILQEIVLYALYDAGFFKHAVFLWWNSIENTVQVAKIFRGFGFFFDKTR